jgi:hypothetical protein
MSFSCSELLDSVSALPGTHDNSLLAQKVKDWLPVRNLRGDPGVARRLISRSITRFRELTSFLPALVELSGVAVKDFHLQPTGKRPTLGSCLAIISVGAASGAQ